MTREDIVLMAREAGIVVTGEAVWKLCELVAAVERNKLAQWMAKHSYATGHGDTTEDLLKELEWQVRERIDAWEHSLAQAIRARGQV